MREFGIASRIKEKKCHFGVKQRNLLVTRIMGPRHIVKVTKYLRPGHGTCTRHALAMFMLSVLGEQLFTRYSKILIRKRTSIPATSENYPVIDNHDARPAGSQFYFKAYFMTFKIFTNKRLICIYFHFNEAVSRLCKFEETVADFGHVQIAISLTDTAENPTKTLLPTFLPSLHFLFVAVS